MSGSERQPEPFDLEGVTARVAPIVELVLRIVGGDFSARGRVSEKRDDLDAIVVALNMLAESFQVEQTKRQRAEALLADAVDAYDHAPGLFCSCEPSTLAIVKCNESMAQALGLDVGDILGRSLVDLVQPVTRAALREALDTLVRSDAHPRLEITLVGRSPEGVVVSVAGSVKRAADGTAERLRLVMRDVTAERRLEEQLLHSQRMEAIGRLAGGVAHDFNNLLMVIQSAAMLLSPKLEGRAQELVELSLIQESVARAAALTKDLLAFSRREPAMERPVTIDELIRRFEPMLTRLLGRSSRLVLRLAAEGAMVKIDPGRLEQVLVNLIVNARDAMASGGEVTLSTRNAPADEARERHPDRSAGPYVEILVADRGTGIPPEVVPRIFEPFFTTKPLGQGTGLGLATVYGTVRQAGGTIGVESAPGRGTTFLIGLPRADAPSKEEARPASGGARQRTILLVEDDDRVRTVTARILEGGGFRVLSAASGGEAIRVAREAASIDLVVSDVIMPGLSGPETVRRLREERPDLRCVFVTGFPQDRRMELTSLSTAILEKPYLPSALLAVVREAIGGRGEDAS